MQQTETSKKEQAKTPAQAEGHVPAAPKRGRPSRDEAPERASKMGVDVALEGEFLIIRIPRKQAAKTLLGELLH